ncbi:MAG: hypothetical protein WDN04_03530 [Rhodospirillales bacterium]
MAGIPAHVPPALVRDIDLFDLPGEHEDVHLAWKKLQDSSRICGSGRAMAAIGW